MSFETMSLKEMREYQGKNPKPADFDEFWDKGIARAMAKDANAEFIPANRKLKNVSCYDLYYDGEDGARIHAKYLVPDCAANGPVPVVFVFHGYTGDAGSWSDKLRFLSQGYAVAAMDCRGQAGQSMDLGGVKGETYLGHIVRGLMEEDPEKLLYRQIYLDTVMLVKAVSARPEIDADRMMVHGGSQGGALSMVCAALNPQIKLAAVAYPFLSDYKRIWEMDSRGSAFVELRDFFRWHDPAHLREEEFFTRLGYIDIQFLMPRVKASVLWATGLQDEAVPASTQFAAYNKLTCEKQQMIYPDFGHEDLRDFDDRVMEFLQL